MRVPRGPSNVPQFLRSGVKAIELTTKPAEPDLCHHPGAVPETLQHCVAWVITPQSLSDELPQSIGQVRYVDAAASVFKHGRIQDTRTLTQLGLPSAQTARAQNRAADHCRSSLANLVRVHECQGYNSMRVIT